jgi:hypothetical protein
MTNRFMRTIAAGTMLTTASGAVGCGYFLHPERRGTLSGVIDGSTMVMDLLWLLPGIVPGVVALIVDFSSGAIYVRGRAALRLSPDGHVVIELPRSSGTTPLSVRLVTASHRVLAQATVAAGREASRNVELQIHESVAEPLFLEVQTADGREARSATSIEPAGV